MIPGVEDSRPPLSSVNGKSALNYAIAQQKVAYYNATRRDREKQIVEYLWGNHGIRRTARADENDYTFNLVYKDHRLGVSMLARDTPSIRLLPLVPRLAPLADPLTQMVNHVLLANDFVVRMDEMLSYGLPIGRGFFKVTWDGTMRMGLGDIRIEPGDPRNIFFIPGISSVRHSLVLSERQYVDKLTLYHRYPDDWKAINELFKRDNKDAMSDDREGGPDTGGFYVNVDGMHTEYLTGAYRAQNEHQEIELWQQWIIDPTTVKMMPKLVDRIKNNAAYKQLRTDQQDRLMNQPLYPKGKLCIFSGRHMFNTRPNPFPSFPYMQFTNQYMPKNKDGDELGMGEYDQLLEVNDAFNSAINQSFDANDGAGTRTIITGGDIDADEWAELNNGLFNAPRGVSVEKVVTPGASPELTRMSTDLFSLAREVQNRSDVSQGQNPSGARSGDQVVELSQLANRVMVTQTHHLEATVRSVVRYCISMMGMYYQKGIHYPDTLDMEGINPDAFEIVVQAGMHLPASESQKLMWLRTLAEVKAIDPEVMLEATPDTILENKSAVLARMRGKWAEADQSIRQQQEAELANQRAGTEKTMAEAQNNVIPMRPEVA